MQQYKMNNRICHYVHEWHNQVIHHCFVHDKSKCLFVSLDESQNFWVWLYPHVSFVTYSMHVNQAKQIEFAKAIKINYIPRVTKSMPIHQERFRPILVLFISFIASFDVLFSIWKYILKKVQNGMTMSQTLTPMASHARSEQISLESIML